MNRGEYKVQVAKDGLLLSFVQSAIGLLIKNTAKIMKADYCESSACIIAWDNTELEMQEKKVHPKNGQAAGGVAQVEVHRHAHRRKKSWLPDEGQGDGIAMQLHCANNCKKAEEQAKAELEVESSYANLFGLIIS
jgi:hypothetical protein